MFSKFRNKPTETGQNPDSAERVEAQEWEQIKTRLKHVEKQLALLSDKVAKLSEVLEKQTRQTAEKTQEKSTEHSQATEIQSVSEAKSPMHLYLSAPSADGMFSGCDTAETIGKSLYRLTTKDGLSGSFEILNSADAVATALISVSQFVKPACRIVGGIPPMPRQITTLEHGMAKKEGDSWRVVSKAVVQFE